MTAHSASPPAFGIIIPARYASARLPGKPLRDLAGKPMIVRVLENASRTRAQFVVVATDDERIAQVVTAAGGQALLTSSEHRCGTDRITEVAVTRELPDETIVVNVQGDEPLLPPDLVERVASNLAVRPDVDMATLAAAFQSSDDPSDENAVKVVISSSGMALYFSRSLIPHQRGELPSPAVTQSRPPLRHIGLYAYRVATLKRLTSQPPVHIEQSESLEQLRALWLDMKIHVDIIEHAPPHGVDTEDDLARAAASLGP